MNAAIYDSSAVDAYIQEQTKREQEITRTRKIENFAKEAPYLLLLWGGRLLAVGLLILCIGYAIKLALSWHHIDETIISNSNPVAHTGYGIDKEKFVEGDVILDVEDILARGNVSNQDNGSISGQTDRSENSSQENISTQQENTQSISESSSGITNSEITSVIPEPSTNQDIDQTSSIEESQVLTSNEEETKNASEEAQNNLPQPEEDTIRKYTVFDRIPFDGKSIDRVVVGRRFNEPGGPIVGTYCYIKVPNSKGIYESIYLITDDSDGRNELPITQDLSKDLKINQQELLAAKSKCKI